LKNQKTATGGKKKKKRNQGNCIDIMSNKHIRAQKKQKAGTA
jgi:hypothetical protein